MRVLLFLLPHLAVDTTSFLELKLYNCSHVDVHNAAKPQPQPQILVQLPKERVTPDIVFDKVVDYASPVYIRQGYVCKSNIFKAYISCLSKPFI